MIFFFLALWNIITGFFSLFTGFLGTTLTLITCLIYLVGAFFRLSIGLYQIAKLVYDYIKYYNLI